MSVGRPSRMTVEIHRVLREQARLRSQVLTLKQLSAQTGFSPTYCQRMMVEIREAISGKVTVSRETNSDTLTSGRTVTPARSEGVAPLAPTASAPNPHEQRR